MSIKKLLLIEEAAETLGIKPETFYKNYIQTRKIPFIKLSNQIKRIDADVFQNFLKKNTVEPRIG